MNSGESADMCCDFIDPKTIELLSVEALNRASVLFFNCLLENHPELIQGFITSYPEVAGMTDEDACKKMFSMLGGHFWREFAYGVPIRRDEFRRHFLEYIGKFGKSNLSCFVGAHHSVAKCLNRDVKKIKYLVFHTHGDIGSIIRAANDFGEKRHRLVLLVRDPRASIWSKKKWTYNLPGMNIFIPPFFLKMYYGIFPGRMHSIKHRELHCDFQAMRTKLASYLGIADVGMGNASFFGVLWEGRMKKGGVFSTSKKGLSTPNPCYVDEEWKQKLSKHEVKEIERVMATIFEEFDYPLFESNIEKSESVPIHLENYFELFANVLPGFLRPLAGYSFRLVLSLPAGKTLMAFFLSFILSVKFIAIAFYFTLLVSFYRQKRKQV